MPKQTDAEAAAVDRLARKKAKLPKRECLPTGYTLLNLGMSGRAKGGIMVGTVVLFIGDASSGKTLLAHTCLAEASISKRFGDYRLIFDNVADGALFELGFFFPSLLPRLEPPAKNKDGSPRYSTTVEDLYYHLDDAIAAGKPFVYVVDDMDTLSSQDARKKFLKDKVIARRRESGKVRFGKDGEEEKEKGSYGDGKAKKNSQHLRQIMPSLKASGSILIIICQTRDNIGAAFWEPDKTRAGGTALRFQANQEIWTSIIKPLTRKVKGNTVKVGQLSRVHIRKNRQTGGDHTIEVPMYRKGGSGIDDLGGMINFLVHWKRWSKEGEPRNPDEGKIDAPELDFVGTKDNLIRMILDRDKGHVLREVVGNVWQEVEEASKVERERRYG